MVRKVAFGLLVTLCAASSVCGQEWARKMFETSQHDFGTVAAGAKAEYEFALTNIYVEDVHIAAVRASCGCTTPSIKKPTLKTYDKGAIVAVFNTKTFVGARGATITVTIDRPFYAEVQLQVAGYIRRDVVLNPGSVQFGTIDEGTGADKAIAIRYAGRDDWKIQAAKSANPHLAFRLKEVARGGGYVDYHLFVHLDENAPSGTLRDNVVLVTNDYYQKDVPVPVEGIVQSGLVVPSTLFMGIVQPGQSVTMPLVIKGKRAFRILSITCESGSFQFDTSAAKEAKQIHVVPVTFTAGSEPGKISKAIRIETDLGEKTPKLSAYAVVAAAGR